MKVSIIAIILIIVIMLRIPDRSDNLQNKQDLQNNNLHAKGESLARLLLWHLYQKFKEKNIL